MKGREEGRKGWLAAGAAGPADDGTRLCAQGATSSPMEGLVRNISRGRWHTLPKESEPCVPEPALPQRQSGRQIM